MDPVTTPQAGNEPQPQAGTMRVTPRTTESQEEPQPQAGGEAKEVKALPAWAQELISNTRAEAAANRKKASDYEKAQQAAEQQRLAEQNRWEELAKQYKVDLDKLTQERDAERRKAMVASVAAKHNLPGDLAGRLIGDTEEELDADAARLAKLIVPVAPNLETGRSGSGRAPVLTLDDIKKRKAASGQYGGV